MEHLNLLEEALNKATQKGAFNLQEVNMIIKSLIALREEQKIDEKPKIDKK